MTTKQSRLFFNSKRCYWTGKRSAQAHRERAGPKTSGIKAGWPRLVETWGAAREPDGGTPGRTWDGKQTAPWRHKISMAAITVRSCEPFNIEKRNTLTDNPSASDPHAIIGDMAGLLAKHKLVPFFGAGISRQHLGIAAAELARDIAAEIGRPSETTLADLADAYIETRGEAAFVAFLNQKLVVADLDERKAPSHRLLVSLMQNLLYTTNQDNLFELMAEKYSRPYRRVVTVNDLSESIPGEPLLINSTVIRPCRHHWCSARSPIKRAERTGSPSGHPPQGRSSRQAPDVPGIQPER